jgi:hypothetical protein
MANKKYKHSKKIIVGILSLVIISVAGIGIALTITDNRNSNKTAEVSDKPSFHYDSAKSPGWYSGGNRWPNLDDYEGGQVTEDDLEVASISVSKGEQGKPSDCFVNYFYWDKPIDDPVIALQKMKAFTIGESKTLTLEDSATHVVSIDTPDGTKEFQLHQYTLAGQGSEQLAKGAQFGYIPVSKGYIEIRGYCNESSQLAATLPAVQSVSLKG